MSKVFLYVVMCALCFTLLDPAVLLAESLEGEVTGLEGNNTVLVEGISSNNSLKGAAVSFLWATPDGDVLPVGKGRVTNSGNTLSVMITEGQGRVSVGMTARISAKGLNKSTAGPEVKEQAKPKRSASARTAVKKWNKRTSVDFAEKHYTYYQNHNSTNSKEALKRLRLAAEAGYLPALYEQGYLLHLEVVKTKDIQTRADAIFYLKSAYQKATELKDPGKINRELAANAAFFLAATFESTKTKPEGMQRAAASWYEKALACPELNDERRKISEKRLCYLTKPGYKCWF